MFCSIKSAAILPYTGQIADVMVFELSGFIVKRFLGDLKQRQILSLDDG